MSLPFTNALESENLYTYTNYTNQLSASYSLAPIEPIDREWLPGQLRALQGAATSASASTSTEDSNSICQSFLPTDQQEPSTTQPSRLNRFQELFRRKMQAELMSATATATATVTPPPLTKSSTKIKQQSTAPPTFDPINKTALGTTLGRLTPNSNQFAPVTGDNHSDSNRSATGTYNYNDANANANANFDNNTPQSFNPAWEDSVTVPSSVRAAFDRLRQQHLVNSSYTDFNLHKPVSQSHSQSQTESSSTTTDSSSITQMHQDNYYSNPQYMSMSMPMPVQAHTQSNPPMYKPQSQQSAYFQRMMAMKLANASSLDDIYQQPRHSSADVGDSSGSCDMPVSTNLSSYPNVNANAHARGHAHTRAQPADIPLDQSAFLPSSSSPMYQMLSRDHCVNLNTNTANYSDTWNHTSPFPPHQGQLSSSSSPATQDRSSSVSYGLQSGAPSAYGYDWSSNMNQHQNQNVDHGYLVGGQTQSRRPESREGHLPPLPPPPPPTHLPPQTWNQPQSHPPAPPSNTYNYPRYNDIDPHLGVQSDYSSIPIAGPSRHQPQEHTIPPRSETEESERSTENRIPLDQIRLVKVEAPRKAILACHFCRGRKLRCDGAQPCTHCCRRNIDCSYDATVRRRGPGKHKKSESEQDKDGSKRMRGDFEVEGEEEHEDEASPKHKAKRGRKPKNKAAPAVTSGGDGQIPGGHQVGIQSMPTSNVSNVDGHYQPQPPREAYGYQQHPPPHMYHYQPY